MNGVFVKDERVRDDDGDVVMFLPNIMNKGLYILPPDPRKMHRLLTGYAETVLSHCRAGPFCDLDKLGVDASFLHALILHKIRSPEDQIPGVYLLESNLHFGTAPPQIPPGMSLSPKTPVLFFRQQIVQRIVLPL